MKVPCNFSVKDILIWLIIFSWLIIDSVTGFFSTKGVSLPISQLAKLGVLALILLRLLSYKKYYLIIFIILFYLGLYFEHLNIRNLPTSYAFLTLSKYLSLLILYLYFSFSVKKFPYQSYLYSIKALLIGGCVVFCNIILGVLGFGVTSYGSDEIDMGVKGFFYAGNELGGILAVLSPFFYYYALDNFYGIKRTLIFILITITGILIGTKTAILSTILSACIIPIMFCPANKRKKVILTIFIIAIILVCIIIKILDDLNIGAIERWQYFYDNGGLTRLLLSGRDEFWDEKKNMFYNSDLFVQFFGMGSEGKIIERDHLDSMTMFGYFGLILIVSFLLYMLFKAILFRHNNPLCKIVILSDILIISIGYIAGHVWFSAMASVYIALINSFILYTPNLIQKYKIKL